MMELLHDLMWLWSFIDTFEVLVVLKCGGGGIHVLWWLMHI